MKPIRLLVGILFWGALVSCATPPLPLRSQPSNNNPRLMTRSTTAPEQVEFQQHTNMLSTQALNALTLVTAESLVFKRPIRSFQIGEVLVGRAGDVDFIRRVKNVLEQPNQIVLQTEPASLFDAFKSLDVRGFRPEKSVQAEKTIDLGKRTFKIGDIAEVTAAIKLEPDFSDTEIHIKNSTLFMRLAPASKIFTDVTTRFKLFSTLDQLTHLLVLPPPKTLGRYSFDAVTIPGWVGPIPIVYSIRPGVSIDLSARARGDLVLGTEITGDVKAGIELTAKWGEQPTAETFHQEKFDALFREPVLEIKGAARLRVNVPEVQMDTKVAGMVGPYVRVGSYVDGQLEKMTTVKPGGAHIKGSIQSDLGVAMWGGITDTQLFGKKLVKGIHVRIFDKTIKELYRKQFDEFVPVP